MSTITVVRKGNEVAIAAHLLSSGNCNRQESAKYIVNHHKVFAVGNSFMAICGATSAKLALQKYFAECVGERHLSDLVAAPRGLERRLFSAPQPGR
ncbi:hypothetical protein [Abditibacterium utsteinense]|uniref:hypothetical protein n=1 Tax=Abditibacterium utsteinense TaxID=1960156 RepID=UPI001EE6D03F|nr:hypothetical protein [Abditibacterium utsteinense]